MAITATITDYVNLAFGEEEPAPPFCKPFGSLGRVEKMARLKDLEDAGYNRWGPPATAKRWDDEVCEGLASLSPADLAKFMSEASTEDREFLERAARRVELRASTGQVFKDLQALSDGDLQAMLAGMSPAERAAIAEIAEAWA